MVRMYFFHLQLHRAVWIHTTLDVNVSSVQVSPTPPQWVWLLAVTCEAAAPHHRHDFSLFKHAGVKEKKEGIYYMQAWLCLGLSKNLPWDSLRTAEHKAAIRNGDVDYAVARQHKKKGRGSASSLRFVGIKRVKPNPRGGNLINQLLRREAFILLIPADSERHRVWVVFFDVRH